MKQLNMFTSKTELPINVAFHLENNQESQDKLNENVRHFSKQCELVYNLMKQGKRLTTRIALLEYNIGDLRRRCKDLRDNYNIDVKSSYVDGSRFKEYYL